MKKNTDFEAFNFACKNQIEIDTRFVKEIGFDSVDTYWAPRPNVWLSKIKKPYRFKALFLILAVLWRYFASYIFIILSWFLTLRKFFFEKNRSTSFKGVNSIFLAFCDKSLSLASCKSIGFQVDVIINFLDDETKDNSNENIYKASELYTFMDLFIALYASLKANLFFQQECKILEGFESYTVFKWFLYKRVIQKFNTNLVIAEHYDRWAVLSDICVAQGNKKYNSSNHLTIVQHGAILGLNVNNLNSISKLKLPYMIKNISYLYVYDTNSLDFFEKNVIHSSAFFNLKNFFFTPEINLERVACSNKSVLIIGHPLSLDFHKKIFFDLHKKNIEVFYKPHPAMKKNISFYNPKWHLISKADFFPEVDFLVSYPSTLVMEYKKHGISSFVHPLAINKTEYKKYKSKILREIKLQGLVKNG